MVNAFLLKSGGFSLILSYVGVLIFVGLTAYDTQKIKQMLIMADDVNEETQKISPFRLAFALSRLYQPLPLSAQDIRKQQRIKDSSVAPFDGANYKC